MVEKMCSDIGIKPSIPQRCGHQRHRSNVPAEIPSDYYRRTISIPLLDQLLSEMKSRFSSHQRTVLLALSVMPSAMVILSTKQYIIKVNELAHMYQDNLPSAECIVSELECWKTKWQHQLREHSQSSIPDSPTLTLRHVTSMYQTLEHWSAFSVVFLLPPAQLKGHSVG